MQIDCKRPWLVVTYPAPQRIVGWSITRPGFVTATTVAWLEVRGDDLAPDVEPAAWMQRRMSECGLAEAVGMMTARNVEKHYRQTAIVDDIHAECLVTLGLNNGERIGRRSRADLGSLPLGTINMLCHVSIPLTDAALLEASSIATQARTVALMEAGYRRDTVDGIITGTGTDCIVMASPVGEPSVGYAGMHTAVGEAVGASVLAATREALAAWLAERTG